MPEFLRIQLRGRRKGLEGGGVAVVLLGMRKLLVFFVLGLNSLLMAEEVEIYEALKMDWERYSKGALVGKVETGKRSLERIIRDSKREERLGAFFRMGTRYVCKDARGKHYLMVLEWERGTKAKDAGKRLLIVRAKKSKGGYRGDVYQFGVEVKHKDLIEPLRNLVVK